MTTYNDQPTPRRRSIIRRRIVPVNPPPKRIRVLPLTVDQSEKVPDYSDEERAEITKRLFE